MVARVQTVAFQGIEAVPVDVQAQIAPRPADSFLIVGLPDKAVKEVERAGARRAARLGPVSLPPKRITVNLAPADLPKEGSHYDLPIALALMAAIGAIPSDALGGYLALGELGLDGRLAPTAGVLPAAIAAHGARPRHHLPGGLGSGGRVGRRRHRHRRAGEPAGAGQSSRRLPALRRGRCRSGTTTPTGLPDLSEVRGQEVARRALEVAAAGGHNLLMIGPPGAGKSMLAQRLPSILPPLNPRELLDVSMIAVDRRRAGGRRAQRPPAVPRAASFGLDGGAGRRRPQGAAGRGQPRP